MRIIEIAELSEFTDVAESDFGSISPSKKGVYYFYDKYDCIIYIGKSKSFRSRFSAHRSGSYFFAHVVKARLFEIESEVDRDIYETYFINKYSPQYNRGKMWSKADLHDYQQELYDLEIEIDEIDSEIEMLLSDFEDYDGIDVCSCVEDIWEGTDFEAYDDEDRLTYSLGESLHQGIRLEELREDREKLNTRLKHIKSFIF